jgi:hypothetical protein
MRIDEIFGSLESIDVISVKGSSVDLVMIVNGYVGDTFEEQEALDRKLMYYNDWAESEEFFALYGDASVNIAVNFTEQPCDSIIERLNVWSKDMSLAKSSLSVSIAGLPLLIMS